MYQEFFYKISRLALLCLTVLGSNYAVSDTVTLEVSGTGIKTNPCFSLWLQGLPADAKVRLPEIKPRYQPGLCVKPQRLLVEIRTRDYEFYRIRVDLRHGNQILKPQLKTKNKAFKTQKKSFKIPGATMEMVLIPQGSFMMGCSPSDNHCIDSEKPRHRVTLESFYMGVTEVTFSQYDYFCEQTGKEKPDDNGWGRGDRPVISVSWNDAQAYIQWLNGLTGQSFRLPTEAEWEYAARAGSATKYYWGNQPNAQYGNGGSRAVWESVGWADQWNPEWEEWPEDGYLNTAPVGSFQPSAWGLYDMAGNVWEWVEDKWHDSYQGAPRNGSAWGSRNSPSRVLRGGSFSVTPFGLRASTRHSGQPGTRGYTHGFRLSLSARL